MTAEECAVRIAALPPTDAPEAVRDLGRLASDLSRLVAVEVPRG